MKIFLKVREEYEQSLVKGEEVVAGIPAYVICHLSFSSLDVGLEADVEKAL